MSGVVAGFRAERVAVLSDVHANADALAAVIGEIEATAPDLIVFGGDLTWGPLPQETLRLVRELPTKALFVRGNAERALLEPSATPTERERWLQAKHTPDDLAFLSSFAEQLVVTVRGLGPVRFCHGSPRSDEECVTPETSEERVRDMTAGIAECVLVTAHTHIQFDRDVAGIRSINAGSVGMPYEGRPGAFWVVLGPDVDLRETGYPVETAAERYRASGDPLSEEMVEMLLQPATRAELIEHAEALQFSG